MEKYVITNCCECGQPFRAVGEEQFVTCPYCGAELSFKPIKNSDYSMRNESLYDSQPDNPLYYDENLEGAPGFYCGDY